MSRLIDADALSEKLCKTTIFVKDGEVFQRMINDAPTVSAEAVQGEWIECLAYNPDLDADVLCIECDQCGHRPYFSGTYRPNYCEECGARMTPYKGGEDK